MAHDLEKKFRTKDVLLLENVDFSSMLLCDRVLAGLAKAGFKKPSPIQLEAIPTGRFGKDLLVQAKSGTGKTLVFAIVALEMLHRKLFRPQVLILVPTREIATQICSVIKNVGSYFPKLTCESFIGGLSVADDVKKAYNCQIVAGTPGRIKHLIEMKALPTNSIRLAVFDEADEMFAYSWHDDIDFIFNSLPEDKQVIATSATYPPKLKRILFKYLRDPYLAQMDTKKLALLGIIHYVKIVESSAMPLRLYKFKLAALEPILKNIKFTQCLVYCNGIHRVEILYRDIKKWGFSTTYISSNRDQAQRLKAIDCLKRFKCKVLVSSDVTARGIDAENVDLVINFDVSNHTETYLHRSGRAGRYGTVGATISIVDLYELQFIKKIEKGANFKSYKLPDPVPIDLIKNPSLDSYAIEASEEIENCDEFTEMESNGFSKDENFATEKSVTAQNGTSSVCAPISIPGDSENISEKQNGATKITCKGLSIVTKESSENNHFNIELNSPVENCSTPKCKIDASICEEAINIIESSEIKSESITKITCSTDEFDSDLSVQNGSKVSEDSNSISENKDVNFAGQGKCRNSDIHNICEYKIESSVLNAYKNSEADNAVASENECIASIDENYSDINVKETLVLSVKDQIVKSSLQDADLNNQLTNEVQLVNSLNENEISHATENFIQKYENMELTVSGNRKVFADLENSVTENSDWKTISFDHVSDLNSRRCDYYYKVFKLFQEGKSCNHSESVMKEDIKGIEEAVEKNPCVKEKMSCNEVNCGENYLKTLEISDESPSVMDSGFVNKLKIENLKKFADNSIAENASMLDDDTLSNISDSPCHESTPHSDQCKQKITKLLDRKAIEQPERNKLAFFDEISDEVSDHEDSLKNSSSHSSSDSVSESCLDSSSSSQSSTSSSEDCKSDKYVSSYYSEESLSGSQTSLDSDSMHSSVCDSKNKLRKNNEYQHDTAQPSACLKKNHHPYHSGDVNAFNLPQCSKQVKARQQLCHFPCGHANLYQHPLPSGQLSSCKQSNCASYSNVYQHPSMPQCSKQVKSRQQPCHFPHGHAYLYKQPLPSRQQSNHASYSNVYQHPHPSVDSESVHTYRRKHANVARVRKNRCDSSNRGQHSSACFMPSEHRCHPYGDSTSCNQRAVCAQWYQMFYNQWLHIQKCCNFPT